MKTHYDVLNLDNSCSQKDVKDSFIRLSKIYHPDKNNNSEAQKKFVEINEAYSVLGKSSSRQKYDQDLLYQERNTVYRRYTGTAQTTVATKTPYEEFVEKYARRKANLGMNNGYKNGSKMFSLWFCFVVMLVGSGLQLGYIRSESRRARLKCHRIALEFQESRDRRRLELVQKLEQIEQSKLNNQYDGFNTSEK